jgi:hypothetical protein
MMGRAEAGRCLLVMKVKLKKTLKKDSGFISGILPGTTAAR